MRIFFLAILCAWVFEPCHAQTAGIRQLQIGDTIPEVVLKGFIGADETKSLSQLHQGKGLIINFWATWCVPCLKELPLLDSLAERNRDRITVLSVTYQNDTTVQKFLKGRKQGGFRNIHILPSDTLLGKYFKHRILPHNVWVDSSGIVRGITGSDGISQENINALYFSGTISAPVKNDMVEFDMHQTFHAMDSNFMYRSILTPYAEGLPGGSSFQAVWHPTERRIIRLFSFNSNKAKLIWDAVNGKKSFSDYYGIMEIQTGDSTRFFWPSECPETFAKSKYESRDEWMRENLYCYELTLPKDVRDTLFFANMLDDMKRSFNIDVSVQNKEIECAIIHYDKSKNVNSESTVTDTAFIDLTAEKLMARNVGVLQLFEYLNENVKPDLNSKPADPPLLDKTKFGYTIDVDLPFSGKIPDYGEIKSMLENKYGLKVTREKHEYPITIIRDLEL